MKGWENFDPTAARKKNDPARQMRNTISRHLGANFEEYIKAACEQYKASGVARIEKTPEPMKVLYPLPNSPGKFVAVFTEAAQPDFKGTMSGGRSICFEAKSTMSDRIEQSVVNQWQTEALDQHEAMGALCFVVVSMGLRSFYRVPWAVWGQMKAMFGHKFMSADELAPYSFAVTNGKVMFLEGI